VEKKMSNEIIVDINLRIQEIEENISHYLKKDRKQYNNFLNQLWARKEELKSLKSRIEKGNLKREIFEAEFPF
jgi:hypothetical protein